jgi:hypothetical protein
LRLSLTEVSAKVEKTIEYSTQTNNMMAAGMAAMLHLIMKLIIDPNGISVLQWQR